MSLTLVLIAAQLAAPAAALAETVIKTRHAASVSALENARSATRKELDANFYQLVQAYVNAPPTDLGQEFNRGYTFASAINTNRAEALGFDGADASLSPTDLQAASVKLLQAYLTMPGDLAPAERIRIEGVFGAAINALVAEGQKHPLATSAPLSPAEPVPPSEPSLDQEQLIRDLEDYFNDPEGVDESNMFFAAEQTAQPAPGPVSFAERGEVWALDAYDAAPGNRPVGASAPTVTTCKSSTRPLAR